MKLDVLQIIAECARLKNERSTLDTLLEDCAAFTCPEKMNIISEASAEGSDDQPRHIICDELSEANSIMSRGLFSNLCPPNMRWFSFAPPKKYRGNDELVRYYTATTQIVYELLMNSNFALEINESFEDFGWAGTVNLGIEPDIDRVFRFTNYHISEYYVKENFQHQIDTVYREFKLTATQVVEKFAGEQIPQKISELAMSTDSSKRDTKFTIIHLVAPNKDQKFDADGVPLIGNENMAWRSVYVVKDEKSIIRESGYDEMPYNVARFEKKSQSVYGFSPAMRVLRTGKITNKAWLTLIKAADKAVDPPAMLDIGAYSKGMSPQFFSNPRAINLYNGHQAGGKPEFAPAPANFPFGLEIFDRLGRRIDKAFFTDMFQLIANINENSKRDRTAFEIQQLAAEKNSMIIPVVARVLEELFTGLLLKAWRIAQRAGEFDHLGVLPEELNREKAQVEYTSPLALATRMSEANIFGNGLTMITPLLQIDPTGVDWINVDGAIQKTFEIAGVSKEYMRTEAEVKLLRKKRAEDAAQQQAQATALEVAKSQDMNKAPESGSMSDQMSGGAIEEMIS